MNILKLKGRSRLLQRPPQPCRNERGSALVFSTLILFLLTVLGVLATNRTDNEIRFSRDDKFHKMAFYQTDGGAEAAKELIEEAIEERGWADQSADPLQIKKVWVTNKDFFQKKSLGNEVPADNNRDAYIEVAVGGRTRNVNLLIGGNSRLSSGGAIQMAAGYEGAGKGSAGGGAWIIYDIRSRHQGAGTSAVQVKAQWMHVM